MFSFHEIQISIEIILSDVGSREGYEIRFSWSKNVITRKEYDKSAGRGYRITQNNAFPGQTMLQLETSIKNVESQNESIL